MFVVPQHDVGLLYTMYVHVSLGYRGHFEWGKYLVEIGHPPAPYHMFTPVSNPMSYFTIDYVFISIIVVYLEKRKDYSR